MYEEMYAGLLNICMYIEYLITPGFAHLLLIFFLQEKEESC